IGGSGLFGTLTGFGSLCVNGRRVELEEAAPVRVDGVEAEASALAVGQVLRIETDVVDGRWSARSVAVEHAVVGPVTAREDAGFRVMGQRVLWSAGDETVPAVGDRVAVSGLVRDDGAVVASRLDAAREDGPDLVRGIASSEGDAFRIGTTPVVFEDEAGARPVGGREVVSGRWDEAGRRLVAREREAAAALPLDARAFELEAYVRADAGGGLSVGGVPIARPGATTVLRVGDRVRVRLARPRQDAALRVEAIQRVREGALVRGIDRATRPPPVVPPVPRGRAERGAPDRPPTTRPPRPPKPPPINDVRRGSPGTGRPRPPAPPSMPPPPPPPHM
ncbi:MAG: DUF5666 domain-containing protein, partial [Myxococcota bacterium]